MSEPDLAQLAPPNVVEALDFESILSSHRADLIARYPAAADVLQLESEPLAKLLEAHAYRELLYRQRVNDAARAHLLAFATGADLDQLAALFGVARMAGETDDRLRERLQRRIAALGAQGTAEHYEYHAMSASQLVRTARASHADPGSVVLMLWISDQAQAESVRTAVAQAIASRGVRILGVPVDVQVAVPRPIAITARIVRTRNAPADLLPQLRARLAAAIAGIDALAGSVARSYITTVLHVSGVHAVEYPDPATPAELTPLAVGEFPSLGTVQLIDGGMA